MIERADATPAALELLRSLAATNGPLMLHQSGGCCDGSSPMCYLQGEFLVGDADVLLGVLGQDDPGLHGGVPLYIGGQQYAYWSHTHLTIDVVDGRGGGFSLEAPEGKRFLTRSRLFTDEQSEALEAAGPPPRGPYVAS
jgi:uncharacterized protein (DUF779 family)